jgi:uncharacterized Fe-S center protein
VSGDLAAWFDQHREQSIRNYRYHCTKCGRFVPMASVVTSYSRPDYEQLDHGTCLRCGRVEVTWGQQ